MTRKAFWTESSIIEAFKAYRTPNEARENAYGAWKAMKRFAKNNPKLEQLAFSHMKQNIKWTNKELKILLKDFQSMGELREKNNPLYFYLWRLNKKDPKIVSALTIHFKDPKPSPIVINAKLKTRITKHYHHEQNQSYVELSPKIEIRISQNVPLQTIKSKIFDSLIATGFIEGIGSYHVNLKFDEPMIKENSFGFHILLKLNLIISNKYNGLCDLTLKNLIIEPYLSWIELELPEILDSINGTESPSKFLIKRNKT